MKYDHKCFKALFTASTGSVYSLNWRFFGETGTGSVYSLNWRFFVETGNVCWQYRQCLLANLSLFNGDTVSDYFKYWKCLLVILSVFTGNNGSVY
jgi:hypothetical protein